MTSARERMGRRLDTSSPPVGAAGLVAQLVEAIRGDVQALVLAQVSQLVREALERGGRAEWLTPKQACAFAGWRSTSTLRAHIAAGDLTRGRGGRVRRDELEAFLASRAAARRSPAEARSAPSAPSPSPAPVDLRRERARRAAREILSTVGGRAE